jgi:hypothetical protein
MRQYDALIHNINELDKKFGTRDFTVNIKLKLDIRDNGNKGSLVMHGVPYSLLNEDMKWKERVDEELLPFIIYQNGVESKDVNMIHIQFDKKYLTLDNSLNYVYIDINDFIDEDLFYVELYTERIYLALCDKLSSVLFKKYNMTHDNEKAFKLFIKIAISKYKMSLNKGGEKCK